jgi:hypothetical protein
MIELFKILTNKYDPEVTHFIQLNNNESTRGHHLQIYKHRARLDIRKYSFMYMYIAVDLWNSLPAPVVSAKSTMQFEIRLDRHWKNQSLYYDLRGKINTRITPTPDHGDPSVDQGSDRELTAEEP